MSVAKLANSHGWIRWALVNGNRLCSCCDPIDLRCQIVYTIMLNDWLLRNHSFSMMHDVAEGHPSYYLTFSFRSVVCWQWFSLIHLTSHSTDHDMCKCAHTYLWSSWIFKWHSGQLSLASRADMISIVMTACSSALAGRTFRFRSERVREETSQMNNFVSDRKYHSSCC